MACSTGPLATARPRSRGYSACRSPLAINDVDLILVPAASVDRTGMRMGWGRGYFDRTLGSMEQCPPVYAVIFDRELVDSVPSEVHDKRVDGVVTPSAIIRF
jgi:5-formyltetrahydrofolate cyclo-ligase